MQVLYSIDHPCMARYVLHSAFFYFIISVSSREQSVCFSPLCKAISCLLLNLWDKIYNQHIFLPIFFSLNLNEKQPQPFFSAVTPGFDWKMHGFDWRISQFALNRRATLDSVMVHHHGLLSSPLTLLIVQVLISQALSRQLRSPCKMP